MEAFELDGGEVMVSAVEHYSYCPRQCALIHVEQTFDENLYTIRGMLAHERVDAGEDTIQAGVRFVRDVPIWSEKLRLHGRADLIEFRDAGPYPVEYKSGRRHGHHADLQVCAQALCLEEMLGVPVPVGAIFYAATRRRVQIVVDDRLREATFRAIHGVRRLLARQDLPEAPNDTRCPRCSLINACLPGVVAQTARLRGLQGALFRPREPDPDQEAFDTRWPAPVEQ